MSEPHVRDVLDVGSKERREESRVQPVMQIDHLSVPVRESQEEAA